MGGGWRDILLAATHPTMLCLLDSKRDHASVSPNVDTRPSPKYGREAAGPHLRKRWSMSPEGTVKPRELDASTLLPYSLPHDFRLVTAPLWSWLSSVNQGLEDI